MTKRETNMCKTGDKELISFIHKSTITNKVRERKKTKEERKTIDNTPPQSYIKLY